MRTLSFSTIRKFALSAVAILFRIMRQALESDTP